MSLLARPLDCGVCGSTIEFVAQWTMTRGWIHPACEPGLPDLPEPWYCPVCDRNVYVCGPKDHSLAPVHLEALAELPEPVPDPIPGQLVLGGIP